MTNNTHGPGILVATVLLSSALLSGRATAQETQVYLPMIWGRSEVNKKGCGGCSADELERINADWAYVWHPRAGAGQLPLVKPGIHQVWEAAPAASRGGWLLWGNEPDQEGPPPEQAAQLYPQAEELGVRIVLATGSHLDSQQAWAKTFRSEYIRQHGKVPRIDALAAHCYYEPGTEGNCIEHATRVLELALEWNVSEVWMTEFACMGDTTACMEATDTFINWMEGQPTITRYFWFGCRINPLDHGGTRYPVLFEFDKPHGITEWGEWYRDQPAEGP